jgi:TRAP transporter TAXI family solute receptor
VGTRLTRRQALHALALTGACVAAGAAACGAPFAQTRLRIATGGTLGVYYSLGIALADVWQGRLGLDARPEVVSTAGSVANLGLLAGGGADVAFCAADAAVDAADAAGPAQTDLRALARIYDDVVHIVVRRDSPVTTLAGLRGMRVSVGAPDSGVAVISTRLLQVAGLDSNRDMAASQLGINESAAAMRDGRIDAFFWSGGLPTPAVSELAAAVPIRLLDLTDLIGAVRQRYPIYEAGTVPAATYGIPEPISTLFVRNFLLVLARMPAELAEALVRALFESRPRLAQASEVARTIDQRTAIGTQPVALHVGAERYYRSAKDA